NFLFRIVGFKKEELGDDQRGHAVFHRPRNEDDPFLEQPRIDVVGPFPTVGLFDHHRDQILHVSVLGIAHDSPEVTDLNLAQCFPPERRPITQSGLSRGGLSKPTAHDGLSGAGLCATQICADIPGARRRAFRLTPHQSSSSLNSSSRETCFSVTLANSNRKSMTLSSNSGARTAASAAGLLR